MNYNYTHIVSKELTEKAIKMLLSGATLVSEPCPYCQGVRVIKDGFALCDGARVIQLPSGCIPIISE